MKRSALVLTITAVLILGGLAAIAGVLYANRTASRSDRWTQAIGTIEGVENGEVTYRYTAGGREHRHRTAVYMPLSNYSAGARVLIYVNPADAAESVMERPRRPPQWPFTAATVAIVAGLTLGAASFKRGKAVGRQAGPHARPKPVRKAAPPLSRLRAPAGAERRRQDEG